MKNLKCTLLVLILLLGGSAAQSQVVQYEYKKKYVKAESEYVVLQVDYTKKRFVYRMHCNPFLSLDDIWGYVEMYGVLHESSPNNPDYMEMEIYDWLHMGIYTTRRNDMFYRNRSPRIERIDGENPKLLLYKYSNDSVAVKVDNKYEKEYEEGFDGKLSSTMYHTKKVKLDKKMYGKNLYKRVVKVNEKIIYNDEIFSPYAYFYIRIYQDYPFSLFPMFNRN